MITIASTSNKRRLINIEDISFVSEREDNNKMGCKIYFRSDPKACVITNESYDDIEKKIRIDKDN